jgi:hypothetical protein
MFLNEVDFNKIPKYFTISAFILALIMPGFGFLYITNQNLLLRLQPIQLILTLLLYSLPIFMFWVVERITLAGKKTYKIIHVIQDASLSTLLYFYGFIIIYQVYMVKFNYIVKGSSQTFSMPQTKAEYIFYGITAICLLYDFIDSKFIHKQNSITTKKNK